MMSDIDIIDAIVSGEMNIKGSSIDNLQPNSLDIFMKPYVTDKKGNILREANFRSSGYVVIYPKEFVLATTKEYLILPNTISASVETRSSIGRMGIFTQNAGHIDAGFEGEITLELFNASNEEVFLNPKEPVAQLVFYRLDNPASKGYNGVYQKQKEVKPSKYIEDVK